MPSKPPPPWLIPLLPLLLATAGCDQIGLPNFLAGNATSEADGRAIGGACRHAGRALEDCYVLNPGVSKAAIFAGWREMNDYMRENQIETVTPTLPPPALQAPKPAEPPPAPPPAAAPAPEPEPEPEPPRRRPGQRS